MRKLIVLIAIVALAAAGCASDDGSDVGQESLPTAPSDPTPTTVPDSPEVEPGDTPLPTDDEAKDLPGTGSDIDAMVDAAVADLADMLSVESDAITVALVESVTWSSGAMGCPEPGMSYTQALVDGVRVELTLDGESYWYHQGGSNPIRYCEDPRDPMEGSSEA